MIIMMMEYRRLAVNLLALSYPTIAAPSPEALTAAPISILQLR
jgi:hypothetical protein